MMDTVPSESALNQNGGEKREEEEEENKKGRGGKKFQMSTVKFVQLRFVATGALCTCPC